MELRRRSRRHLHRGCAALGVLAAVAIAGCSSGGSTSGSGSSSSGAAGSSYKIGWIVDLSNDGGASVPGNDAFDSAVKAVNAQGGVHGHPITVVTCDSQTNDNGAAACGQQLVSDHVSGVVDFSQEDTFMPYLEAAGIPVLDTGGTPSLYTDSVSFVTSDLLGETAGGLLAVVKQAGCKTVVAVDDVAGSAAGNELLGKGQTAAAARFGLVFKGAIAVPPSAPDLSPYEDEASQKGAQCVVSLANGATEISALQALVPLVQEGKFQKVITATANLTYPGTEAAETPLINELGSHIVLMGASETPADTANPAVVKWVHDETAYNVEKIPDLEGVTAALWADLQLLVEAGNATYPKDSASSVLSYLDHLNNFWPGVFPEESFTKAVPNPYGPRDFGSWAATFQWAPNGVDMKRVSPFVSVLNGATYANPVPPNFNASSFK